MKGGDPSDGCSPISAPPSSVSVVHVGIADSERYPVIPAELEQRKGAYIVQINIDTPKVSQHEISYGICPLDRLAVVVEGV